MICTIGSSKDTRTFEEKLEWAQVYVDCYNNSPDDGGEGDWVRSGRANWGYAILAGNVKLANEIWASWTDDDYYSGVLVDYNASEEQLDHISDLCDF